jgi:hypothetical protein
MLKAGDIITSVQQMRELPKGSVVRIDNITNQPGYDVVIRKENIATTDEQPDWSSVGSAEELRSDKIIKEYEDAVVTLLFINDDSTY